MNSGDNDQFRHSPKTSGAHKDFPPIALIGMGCLFPKGDNLSGYWATVREGVDAIREVPEDHWRIADYYDPDPKKPDYTHAQKGGFLDKMDFDPLEYGVLPNAVEATDTTQLLSLIAAGQALDDAGYGLNRDFNRERVSVVLGVTGALELVIPLGARLGHPIWRRALHDAGVDEATAEDVVARISEGYVPWQENSFPGLLGNVTAGRISKYFNLGGTNCVVDAACGSSLSALHLGALELAAGKSDMVVTGGADTFNDIFMYMCFSKTFALSPDGEARPFSDRANGTALGEGIGIVVAKRLEDAERDGDRIYAVIRGIGTSSDGKGEAIYAPSVEGQTRALRDAYAQSGFDPSSIELVEAHGTGTKAGDAAEIRALSEVYGVRKNGVPWCALGSVKSQLGHTKAAAGAAGLIKAVLALHHKVLPPTIKVDQPAEIFKEESTPFYINTSKRPWLPKEESPRRAAVSAFGFGGSNFHCVLEEYTPNKPGIDWDGNAQIMAFSGASSADIETQLREVPSEEPWPKLRAYAAGTRETFDPSAPYRVCLVMERDGTPISELIDQARRRISGDETARTPGAAKHVYYGHGPATGKLGLVFPGQGSQYVNMLRDAVCAFPEALDTLSLANNLFQSERTAEGDPSEYAARLSDAIYPTPVFSQEERTKQEEALRKTDIAQPAIGAVSLGALRVLTHFGVQPDAVAGHSFGELTALCAAGWISEADLLKLSILRGKLMAQCPGGKGGMLAIRAPLEDIEDLLGASEFGEALASKRLVIANKNAPNQAVISGELELLDRVEGLCKEQGMRAIRLPVAAAFHSALVQDAASPFREALEAVTITPTEVPVYSNTTGQAYPKDPATIRDMLAHQLAEPVEFVNEVRAMHEAGVSTFVEVGPKSVLTGLIGQTLDDNPHTTLALDPSAGKGNGMVDLAHVLAQLAASGHAPDISKCDPNPPTPAHRSGNGKKRLTIPISGANYFKPKATRPPRSIQSGEDATPSPQNISNKEEPRPSEQVHTMEPRQDEAPRQAGHHTQPRPEFTQNRAAEAPSTQSSQPAPGPAWQDAMQYTQENLRALQRMQEQTAQLHKQFLEGQQETVRAFQALVEQQQQGLVYGKTASPAQEPLQAPVPSQPQPWPQSESPLPRASEPSPEPPAASTPPAQGTQAVPSPAPATEEPPSPQPAPVPKTQPAAASNGQDVDGTLMEIVAEKTGYPAEMLELGMHLDTDLGIDSIKRVEILSAIQDQFPGTPPIESDQMGSFQTLDDIAQYLRAHSPAQSGETSTANSAAASESDAQQSAPSAPSSSGQPNGDITGLLLDVVAEKTGYPAEMLELDMALDTDLGIDSIKRVEILSAIQEKLPEVPQVESDVLGQLHTLRDIAAHLQASGVAPAPRSQGNGSEASTAPAEAKANSSETDSSQIADLLVGIVAEKTGYPPEMLEMDMTLDGDLGIDSIKRVEILSAVQEQLPEAAAIESEQLGTLRTLRDIVAHLQNGGVGGATAEPPPIQADSPEASSAHEPEKVDIRDAPYNPPDKYVLRSVPLESRNEGDAISLPKGAVVWLLGGPQELADAITTALADRGVTAVQMDAHGEAIAEPPAELAGLIALPAPASTPGEYIQKVFQVLKASGERLRQHAGQAFFATVTQLDGQFGVSGTVPASDPALGGLAGLAKTAAQEWPEVRCKALDIAPEAAQSQDIAQRILETALSAGPMEIGIGTSGLTTLQLEKQPASANEANQTLIEPGALVLVTGGGRGVTAEVCVALAEQYQPAFLLLGRTPAPREEPAWLAELSNEQAIKRALVERGNAASPKEAESRYRGIAANRELRNNITRIEQAGGTVMYRAADVRDANAVEAVIEEARREFGPVAGLVHGAGVLADRYIADKTTEQFALVYETKAKSFAELLPILQDDPLRFIACFSSSTARFGRVGQIDYAAANEAVNKLAQAEACKRQDCKVLSINWGPWDGGMVTPALRDRFREEGIEVIGLRDGTQFLMNELPAQGEGAVEVVVLGAGSRVPYVLSQASPADSSTESTPAEGASASESPATPANTNGTVTAFQVEVDLDRFPVLYSHVVGGRAVVPVVLVAEWFAHGALHLNPGLRFLGLDDLRVLKGVILEPGETRTLQVTADPARIDGDQYRVPLMLIGQGPDGRERTHARAEVLLGTRYGAVEPSVGSPLLEPYELTPDQIYRDGHLFHGEAFQGIQELEGCGKDGIAGIVQPAPAPRKWIQKPLRNTWLTDPLALDCAFQLIVLWTRQYYGYASLPSRLGRYRQFMKAFPKNPVKIVGRVTNQGKRKVLATLEFLDTSNGNLIARLEDYEAIVDASVNEAYTKNRLPVNSPASAGSTST